MILDWYHVVICLFYELVHQFEIDYCFDGVGVLCVLGDVYRLDENVVVGLSYFMCEGFDFLG